MSKLGKEYFQMAERLIGENNKQLNEDDGKKLIMNLAVALGSYEDFRQDVKEIVNNKYQDKKGEMVKVFSAVDKAINSLEKFIKTL